MRWRRCYECYGLLKSEKRQRAVNLKSGNAEQHNQRGLHPMPKAFFQKQDRLIHVSLRAPPALNDDAGRTVRDDTEERGDKSICSRGQAKHCGRVPAYKSRSASQVCRHRACDIRCRPRTCLRRRDHVVDGPVHISRRQVDTPPLNGSPIRFMPAAAARCQSNSRQ